MKRLWWMAALLTIAVAAPVFADTVKLRSGKVVTGQFIGGDSKSVRVLLDSGIVSEVPLDQAVAVEFSPRKPAPPPAPPPAAKPAPVAAAAAPKPPPPPERRKVTVPSGTALNVRLTEGIDVDATAADLLVDGGIDPSFDDLHRAGGCLIGGQEGLSRREGFWRRLDQRFRIGLRHGQGACAQPQQTLAA